MWFWRDKYYQDLKAIAAEAGAFPEPNPKFGIVVQTGKCVECGKQVSDASKHQRYA